MQEFQFSLLFKLYRFGKRLAALAKLHNSDQLGKIIILRLAAEEPVSVSRVTDLLSIKVSAATTRILEMEKEGLLARVPDEDRRSHTVAATAKGRAKLAASKREFMKKYTGLSIGLTPEEAATLAHLIDKIRLEVPHEKCS